MIIYLTFGDGPSGIYRSQVEDFVLYLKKISSEKVRLVAFISIRDFFKNKKTIKGNLPDAIILPMIPGLKNWKLNRYILYIICLIFKPYFILGRSVLATYLALQCQRKKLVKEVIYDGRGAIAAEWNEYDVVTDVYLKNNIKEWEKYVVMNTGKQIAVSEKLVDYWKQEFRFDGNNFSIIPCTLDSAYIKQEIAPSDVIEARRRMDISEDKIVLVYSGSIAGWQSVDTLFNYLGGILTRQQNVVLVFLGKETRQIASLAVAFPGRVQQYFLKPEEVPFYLKGCDYGLLIREPSITNRVAAPVKFAEYLACGLKIIISPGIGDYSDLTKEKTLGYFHNEIPEYLPSVQLKERTAAFNIAMSLFVKDSYRSQYQHLMDK